MNKNELKTLRKNLKMRRARFVYEGARLHIIALECPVKAPPPWELRSNGFKNQFIELVRDISFEKRNFTTPEKAYISQAQKYLDLGYECNEPYGPVKEKHPNLVPYEELDPKEKIKDEVFLWLVKMAKRFIW